MKRVLVAVAAALLAAPPALAEAKIPQVASPPPSPPSPAGALLSLLYPGGGQFYAGDPVRGFVYLGLGFGAGLAGFGVMMAQLPGGVQPSAEETALSGIVGYGALLVVEAVSSIDALLEISSQQGAAVASTPLGLAPAPGTPVVSPAPSRPVPASLPALPLHPPGPGGSAPSPVSMVPAPAGPGSVPVSGPILAPVAPVPVAPVPVAASTPASVQPDLDSQRILQAYELAGAGDHAGALQVLKAVQSPGFAPKVRALVQQWGPLAASELVARADRLAWQGRTTDALDAVQRALALPASPATRAAALRMQARLDETLSRPQSGASSH